MPQNTQRHMPPPADLGQEGTPGTPNTTTAALAYADDLGILESCHRRLLHQFHKLKQYCTWGQLSLNASKCAVTGILHRLASSSSGLPLTAQTDLLRQQLGSAFQVGSDTIPFLPPDQPYKYLGVWLTLTLNFRFHFNHLQDIILEKGMQLISAAVPPRQCLTLIQNVLKPKITYCFPIAPFSRTDVAALDNLLIRITRHSMKLSHNISNIIVLSPTTRGGVGLISLMADYAAIATQTLTQALHDQGDLGQLTCYSLDRQLADYGHLPAPMAHRNTAFSRHPMALRLLSLASEAKIILHTNHTSHTPAFMHLTGNPMWKSLTNALSTMAHTQAHTPQPAQLRPLWCLGLSSFEPLAVTISGQPHLIGTDILLHAFKTKVSNRTLNAARLALNRLTLFLHGSPTWHTYTSVTPLPLPLRSVLVPHTFASIPQPTFTFVTTTSTLVTQLGPQATTYPMAPHPTQGTQPILGYPTLDLTTIGPSTRAHMPLSATPGEYVLDLSLPPQKRRPPSGNPPTSQTSTTDPPPLDPRLTGPTQKAMLSCLFDKFVHVNTTPANPDFDILPTNSFTIQVGLCQPPPPPVAPPTQIPPPLETQRTRAFVYRPNGTCVGSISRERLVWLHTCYHHSRQENPTLHSQLSTGSFASDLASTLTHNNCNQKSTAKLPHPNANWTIPLPVTTLANSIGIHNLRIASPLTAPTSAQGYQTDNFTDQLFGASTKPYSNVWTGLSLAFPDFTSVSILKAIRWAVASAEASPGPSGTLMLLPNWTTSSFMPWIRNHPNIRTLRTYAPGTLEFPIPCYLANIQPDTPQTNTHWSMLLILISNTPGYQAVSSTEGFKIAFPAAPLASPPRLSPTFKCWGPPAGFKKVSTRPEEGPPSPLVKLPPVLTPGQFLDCALTFKAHSPLKWVGHTAYYTDGACHTGQPAQGNQSQLGAAFFYSQDDSTYMVKPGGHRETHTVVRAELAGIHGALVHAKEHNPDKAVILFCDTLTCLHTIRNTLFSLHTMTTHKHLPMLTLIRDLLKQRATDHVHTTLQKVISHIGVHGNERADTGATQALQHPESCTYDCTDIPSDHFSKLPAWPCFVTQHPDLPPRVTFMANLTSAVKKYIYDNCPDLTDGACKRTATYAHQQLMNTLCLPAVSNYMWQTATCPFWMIKNIINIRSRTLWTATRAHLCHLPYTTKAGTCLDGNCPICETGTAPDTAGHILGSCNHPDMNKQYITRHNKALHIIQRAIFRGPKGGYFTIMDATSVDNLPCGVAFTRIPKAFLPALTENVRSKYRPDIMLVEGLPSVGPSAPTSLSFTWDSRTTSDLQSRCKIHILEFGYCSDKSHTDCTTRKQAQHQELIAALRNVGWVVTSHIAIITTSGQIFKNVSDSTAFFGVPEKDITPMLQRLHVHTVKTAFYMVKLRRRLENNPAHFHATVMEDRPP